MPTPDLHAAAKHLAASPPPLPDGWPAKGRVWPTRAVGRVLAQYGCPTTTVTIDLPQHEHGRGRHEGQRTGDAPQAVTCVPVTWVVELARLMRARLGELVRARVDDE